MHDGCSTLSVMPAKAGTPLSSAGSQSGFPAFAGMTNKEVAAVRSLFVVTGLSLLLFGGRCTWNAAPILTLTFNWIMSGEAGTSEQGAAFAWLFIMGWLVGGILPIMGGIAMIWLGWKVVSRSSS
jgi:hypothetical protein